MSAPTYKTSGGFWQAQVSVGISMHQAMEACRVLVESMNGRQLSHAMADDFELMARDIREKIESELQREAAAVNTAPTTAATAAEGKGHG